MIQAELSIYWRQASVLEKAICLGEAYIANDCKLKIGTSNK